MRHIMAFEAVLARYTPDPTELSRHALPCDPRSIAPCLPEKEPEDKPYEPQPIVPALPNPRAPFPEPDDFPPSRPEPGGPPYNVPF